MTYTDEKGNAMTYDEALQVIALTRWTKHFYSVGGFGDWWCHDVYDEELGWVRNSAQRNSEEASKAAFVVWVRDGCPTIESPTEDKERYDVGRPKII